jgi:aldehyde:ferredoxin oxidoreductase
MDDFGIWDGYLVMGATFKYIVDKGIVREKLSEAEYNSINWPGYENGDPEFIFDIVRRIAFKDGELGTALGLGPIRLAERWGIYDQLTNAEEAKIWTRGNGQRHYNGGQIGSLVHIIFNNEACTQEFSQMTVSSGLPWEAQKEIGKQLFGGDFIDFNGMMSGGGDLMTPMNEYKAKFAAFAVNEKMLKDSLTLCNRAFAVKISPLKERNYVGDLTLESQMYSLVTGDVKDFDELQLAGNRMATLLRAITLRDYNTKNIRNEHDYVPEYMFADQHNIEPFTKGSIYLDREDWEVAKDMFYGKMGWDTTTGAPTRAHLEKVGLKYVADELAAKALLP